MFTDLNINHLCLSLHSLSNLKDLIFKSIFYIFIILYLAVSLQTKDMLKICRYFSCINKLEYLHISGIYYII